MIKVKPNPNPLPYLLLAFCAASVVFFYWPGFLSPDSKTQLSQAISGQYSDHHPPLMAIYWSLWLWWKQGPEPIFLTYQFLLFSSAFLFLKTLQHKKISWIIPFLPLIPHILFYSGAIWKDVGFAYTYLLAAILIFYTDYNQKKLSLLTAAVIWLLLFYGTGVKYQAIFVLPIIALWFSITLLKQQNTLKKLILCFVIWGSILGANSLLQTILLSDAGENHSWQKVKLYDLAGISLQLNQELFPEFVKQAPEYAFKKVKKIYSPQRVDELLVGWGPEASLRQGEIKEHRDILWNTWFQEIKNHPLEYLTHRFAIWKTMVSKSPLKSLDDLTDVEALPPKVKFILNTVGLSTLNFIKEATRFIYYIPLLLFYFVLGLWNWRRKPKYAVPLTMMTASSLALMGALFIFSMASDLRYIYLTMTFFHFCHPLAWLTLVDQKEKRSPHKERS